MQIVRKQITVLRTFLRKIPPHLWTASTAWATKLIYVLVQIVSIRTLLFYLGEDRYAAYIIAFSITAWTALANFNIGTSLQNYISECRAKNQNPEKYLIAALQISLLLALVFIGAIIFASGFVQNVLFKKFILIVPELRTIPIVLIVASVSIMAQIFIIATYVYTANHRGFIVNILSALASIASMITIVLFNRYSYELVIDTGGLITALLIFTVPQLFVYGIMFIKSFGKYFRQILRVDWACFKSLFIRALKFQGISVFYIASMQIDYLIISQTLKTQDIIVYNVFLRFFMLPIFMFIAFCGSSWPRISEMFIEKKTDELKGILKRYLFYGFLLSVFCSLAILFLSPYALKILMPQIVIEYSKWLIVLFGIYAFLNCSMELGKTFLLSINAVRVFWIYMPFQIIIGGLSQFFLSKKYGAEGIVMGFIISVLLTAFWILPLKIKKILVPSDNNSSKTDKT
jgi:O-antigen/teichoic acid export membrane protein